MLLLDTATNNWGFFFFFFRGGGFFYLDVQIGRLFQALEGMGEDDGLFLAATQAVGSNQLWDLFFIVAISVT